jgi:pimeloyl-ACP methyl ester carboxylesterase
METQRSTFEARRLALFAGHGFAGRSRWLADRHGRYTYAIDGGDRGDGRPAVVLVHGGLSQAGEWLSLAGRIDGHVVIPDRPGCGLGYPIDYRGLDYRRAAAAWLLDLLDALDLDEVDLVGNSMGGFFAVAFALAHPQRVRRLALVGAPAGLDRQLPLFVRLLGHPVTGPLLARMRTDDPEAFRRRVVARLLAARPERVPPAFLELAVTAAALPGADQASRSMLGAVTTLRGWRCELLLREELAALPVPTLFLWGDADAFAPPSSGAELAARMPCAGIEVLAEAGHLPWLDRPDAVAASLAGFFDRGPARAGGRSRLVS